MEDDFFSSPVALSLARATPCPVHWPGAAWQSPSRARSCTFLQPSSTQSAVLPSSGTCLLSICFCVPEHV